MTQLPGTSSGIFFLVLCLYCILSVCHGQTEVASGMDSCEQGINCVLPDCFCANNTEGPSNITAQKRPQIVVLTFNDAVNERNFKYYTDMLTSGWKNANGCPVSLTLFVPDTWTNYTQVQKLWLAGAEIASFGKAGYGQTLYYYKTITRDLLREEIGGQKENFVKKAKIPPEYIRGFRVPYFGTSGDEMFEVLAEEGYHYDSSLLIGRKSLDAPPSWPATLTYDWPFECKHGRCPTSNHSSLWEIPVNLLLDLDERFECQFIDACTNAPTNEEDAFQLLWRNFLPFYRNRTPFVLNMRATWLNTDFQRTAFHRLIYSLLEMPEVYMVSMSQMVDWMKNTTSLEDIQSFQPWQCDKRQLYRGGAQTSCLNSLLPVMGILLWMVCYVYK